MTRAAPGSVIPDDFGYTKHPELRKWIESEYPTLDADQTMARFIEYAEDSGRMATKWTAAFKRVIRTGIDNGWKGICVFKQGRTYDPKWTTVLKEAKLCGFRDPEPQETPDSFRTAMKLWLSNTKRVPDIGEVFKVMRK